MICRTFMTVILAVPCSIGVFLPGSAMASNEDVISDVRACAAISQPSGRLECFDLLIGKHGLNAPVPPSSQASGAWSVSVDKSPIDDSKLMSATLVASKVAGGSGIGNPTAYLNVRCREAHLNLYFGTSAFMGSSDPLAVLIRIGSQVARQDRWTPSSDGRAVGLWDGDKTRAVSLVNQLISSEPPSLVLRSDVFHGAPITAQFDVSGAKEALEPILALCAAASQPKKPGAGR